MTIEGESPPNRDSKPPVAASTAEDSAAGTTTNEGIVAERRRQAALDSYGVNDADDDEAINGLVRMAARVLDMPIALVSLVDGTRQRFLSSVGLPGLKDAPREIAFCAHAILTPGLMEVGDATKDPRFASNPMVTGEPQIRFYAGMPLVNKEGFALGTLCVLDRKPRTLAAVQEETLGDLARATMVILEARRLAARLGHSLEARRRQNEHLLLAEDVADVGHWRITIGEEEVYWSPQIYRIYGHDPATFRPTLESAIAAYHPEDRERVNRLVRRAVERQEAFDFSLRLIRSDGSIRVVHARGRCEPDPTTGETLAVVGVFQDITEREELRITSEHRSRLVTVGTLAAGVGHEINNPLTYVAANLEVAIGEIQALGKASPVEKMHAVAEILDEAREGAERIRNIVRGLQALARGETVSAPTDVLAAIDVSISMTKHEFRNSATLMTHLTAVAPVLGDSSRLVQVFINLLVNAAQSFASADAKRNQVTVSSREEDGRVMIEVGDNGPGIPPEIVGRIFDPFFTTKPVGKGTGLGLSISHGVVESLGGTLTCASVVGEGTTFRVSLPALRDASVASKPRATDAPPQGSAS